MWRHEKKKNIFFLKLLTNLDDGLDERIPEHIYFLYSDLCDVTLDNTSIEQVWWEDSETYLFLVFRYCDVTKFLITFKQ